MVLLIEKIRGPHHLRGHLNGLGGKIEVDETPSEAMVREFEEESGAHTKPEDWEIFAVQTSEWGTIHFLRHFAKLEGVQIWKNSLTDETVGWYQLYHQGSWAPELKWLVPLSLDPGLCTSHFHPSIQFPLRFTSLSNLSPEGL